MLFEFKFNEILKGTDLDKIGNLVDRVAHLTIFNYLAKSFLDLKSLIVPQFISTLNEFTYTATSQPNFNLLLGEVTDPSMNTQFYLQLSDFFMTTSYNEESGDESVRISQIATTFHGWTHETVYLFSRYADRISSIITDSNPSNIEDIDIYQVAERNPLHFDRQKARYFNIDLLQSQLKTVRESIDNGIDVSSYYRLPVNSREFDILVLLILGITPTFFSTHLKGIRTDLLYDTERIGDRKRQGARDSLSHIVEPSEYWFTTESFQRGNIQGPRQVSDIGIPTFGTRDGRINAEETIKFIFGTLQSTDSLYEKGVLDSQVNHKIVEVLNKYIEGLTFPSQDKVEEEIYLLLSSYAEIEIKQEVEQIYKRADEKKLAEILDNWNTIYSGIKNLFSKRSKDFLIALPNNQFTLIWKDSISHFFRRLDQNGNPIELDVDMFSDNLHVFDASNPSLLRSISQNDLKMPLVVFHNKITKENILVRSDETHLVSSDYILGYYDQGKGEIFTNGILNTINGHILDGRIELNNGDLKLNDENWFISKLDNPHYFVESSGIFTLLNCYRDIIYLTGDNVMIFLQESEYNFIPTVSHTSYFTKEFQKSSNLKDLSHITVSFSLKQSMEQLFGSEFNQESLFKIFFNLFDQTRRTFEEQFTDFYILKFMDVLNGVLKDGRLFTLGPNQQRINYVIKELFRDNGYFDWTELNKFAYKKSDGKTFNNNLEFKEWLDLMYRRIVDYTGTDPKILSQKQILQQLAPLDVLSDREFLTDNEIKVSRIILSATQQLFGHITLRLIWMNMLSLNDDVSFRVNQRPIYDELFNIMRHVGYIPPSYRSQSSDMPRVTTRESHRDTLSMGAFLLDSHIAFRKGNNYFTSRQDSFILPYGPVALPDTILFSSDPSYISWEIAEKLSYLYSENFGQYDNIDKSDLFLETQESLINVLENQIITQVRSDSIIPLEEKSRLIYRLISDVRTMIPKTGALRDSDLIAQIYDFLESGSQYGQLKFRNNYILDLHLDQFEGENLYHWRRVYKQEDLDSIALKKRLKIDENVDNFLGHITALINDIGGQAELFSLFDDNLGGYKGNYYTKKVNFMFNKYTLDLRDPETTSNTEEKYQKSQSLLKYVGYMMAAYPNVFVLKTLGSSYNDGGMITAFNYAGFLKDEEIFSIGQGYGQIFTNLFYSPVFPDIDDPGFFISFYDDFGDPINTGRITNYYRQNNEEWILSIWKHKLNFNLIEFLEIKEEVKAGVSQFAQNIQAIAEEPDFIGLEFLHT